MRPLAEARQIALSLQASAVTSVLADRTRLKQVLLNLQPNAIKYGQENGQVWVSVQPADSQVRITVGDTDPGIPPEYRTRLLQPFSRRRLETHSVEGRGMGLAVSQRPVEAMQGRIGLAAPPGRGCQFWIELPQPPTLP